MHHSTFNIHPEVSPVSVAVWSRAGTRRAPAVFRISDSYAIWRIRFALLKYNPPLPRTLAFPWFRKLAATLGSR
eukprot:6756907-Pyramimonas_sp.AAC.1